MSPRRFLRRRLERLGFDPEDLGEDLITSMLSLDGALRDLAGGDGAPQGFDPQTYLAPGVPRVRPVLVLLSAQAAQLSEGAQRQANHADAVSGAEHVAAAAELLHIAITVHDAALGQRGARRRRVARRVLGGAVGWLGGNHLTLRALELSRHAPSPDIVGDLLDTMREITQGQALAQALQGGHTGNADQAITLADTRSGAVFAFACRAGARLVGADRTVVRSLGRYGRHTGIAWHLADDLWALGLQGDDLLAEVSDRAAAGRTPLAVSLAAQRDPAIGDAWRRLSRRPDAGLAQHLAQRVSDAGGLQEERERLVLESWTARKALHDLPPSPHREALDHFAARLAI